MRRIQRAAVVLALTSLVVGVLAAPAGAAPGAKNLQVRGDSLWDTAACPGGLELMPQANGWGLEGCLTPASETGYRVSAAGVEKIYGTEEFVGTLGYYDDGSLVAGTSTGGSFVTSFQITAKWNVPDYTVQYHGRCQHPIVEGSGLGGFEGAEGRIDFSDTIVDGAATNFPYKGHIKAPNS